MAHGVVRDDELGGDLLTYGLTRSFRLEAGTPIILVEYTIMLLILK